jgi:hypothetical protein
MCGTCCALICTYISLFSYRVLTEGRLFEALDYFFYRGDFEETIASGDVMMPLVVKLCTQHRGVMAKLPFSTHKLVRMMWLLTLLSSS